MRQAEHANIKVGKTKLMLQMKTLKTTRQPEIKSIIEKLITGLAATGSALFVFYYVFNLWSAHTL